MYDFKVNSIYTETKQHVSILFVKIISIQYFTEKQVSSLSEKG